MSVSLTEAQIEDAHRLLEQSLYEMKRVVVGQSKLLERLLLAVICQGHVLVEGAPGLAKTLALKTMAHVLRVDFKRIQFTPDLLPGDLIGTRIYHPAHSTFHTEKGPVFAHFVLADEINRAPAKVQSALLEAMQEHQVTLGLDSFSLPKPFLVMATQNPIESEGTYPLPEAQLDRFLFKVLVDYPSHDEELLILERVIETGLPQPTPILDAETLLKLHQTAQQVFLESTLMSRIVHWVQATRQPHPMILYGASPRATLAMAMAAKGHALLKGRGYVLLEDLEAVVYDCLRHRIVLSYEALAENQTADRVLTRLLKADTMVTAETQR